jgi:hypothetical protein
MNNLIEHFNTRVYRYLHNQGENEGKLRICSLYKSFYKLSWRIYKYKLKTSYEHVVNHFYKHLNKYYVIMQVHISFSKRSFTLVSGYDKLGF